MDIDNGRKRTASVRFRQVAFNGRTRRFRWRFAALASLPLLELANAVSSTIELNQVVR
jgi:hypothetical protein